MRSGTYRGTSDDLSIEFHLECDDAGVATTLSGDVYVSNRFLASLLCQKVQASTVKAEGPVIFRGNERLFTGAISFEADARGLGAFQLTVDLEGGHQDHLVGRLEWQGSYFRKIAIEVDGILGQPYFDAYTSRAGTRITLEAAFERAGIDAQVTVDTFTQDGPGNVLKGYSLAEVHRAMEVMRNKPTTPGRLHTHVFVCTYLAERDGRGVLGVMYDLDQYDLNRRPREGVAIFGQHPKFSDPRNSDEDRRREFVYTVIHEVGHALNLQHSFEKGRPSALSWMNYPQYYPLGSQGDLTRDGSAEFWRAFPEGFDELELRHLRHATYREIGAGGFAFGSYEEGARSIYEEGSAEPRRTSIMSNPLRQAANVKLVAWACKRDYHLGEPVFVQLEVKSGPGVNALIPDALDPSEGFTRFVIERPNGQRVQYRPPHRVCSRSRHFLLESGGDPKVSHAIPLFISNEGPVFTEPGTYKVWAELGGIEGVKVAFAEPFMIRVGLPDRETERFAETLFESPRLFTPLYLRHPLSDKTAWGKLEEAARRVRTKEGNGSWSYINYVAALGWLKEFEVPGNLAPAPFDPERARVRLLEVQPELLPASARARVKSFSEGGTTEARRTSRYFATNAKEQFRGKVPPSGLFGQTGLDRPDGSSKVSPFAIVLQSHDDGPAFADIACWNIPRLHGKAKSGRIGRLARYMLAFRLDFWALQEVGLHGLRELVDAMNINGDLTYDFQLGRDVKGDGDAGLHCACVYRTDTVRVRELSAPDFFAGNATLSKGNGVSKKAKLFLRRPLLCEVRVKQGIDRLYEFRCAIVQSNVVDPTLAAKDDDMLIAASKELARWMRSEEAGGGGLAVGSDILILGNTDANEVQKELMSLAEERGFPLRSIQVTGMKGAAVEGAITRFSSKRTVDHIVVTEDSKRHPPRSAMRKQIVVPTDINLGELTERLAEEFFASQKLSDHLPVAVRLVPGRVGRNNSQ